MLLMDELNRILIVDGLIKFSKCYVCAVDTAQERLIHSLEEDNLEKKFFSWENIKR